MISLRSFFALAPFCGFVLACSSNDTSGGSGRTSGTTGADTTGTTSTDGSTGLDTTGTSSTAGGATGTTGATSGGTSGDTSSGTNGGSSGTGGSTGTVTGSNGSASSSSGGASDGGTTGASDGGSGEGGSGGLHGGASARFICLPGATYGNPLTGMGQVTQMMAPTTGSVTYFAFIEGPVWIGSLGTLFFSDNASSPAERIFKLVPPSTTPQVFLENSGSNGLAIDNDDNLVLADQRNHRIVRVDSKTAQMLDEIVPAGNFKPNDVLVSSTNNVYFTDPDTGFYRVSPSKALTGPMKQVNRPNGIELSLDERTLYVGDVGNQTITKFAVAADGTVDTSSAAMFTKAMGTTVDGMAIDCAGNVYASTQTGVEVYSPSGTLIGTVPTGESSNCTFGGADHKTLYVTSRSVLKAVTLAVPGLPD